MATSLDNLIDNYVQLKKDILFSKVNDEDLALFIDMTKKELKREIREEIEEEVKERALKKAQRVRKKQDCDELLSLKS